MMRTKLVYRPLTRASATIAGDSGRKSLLKHCLCCLAEFRPKNKRQGFCQDRCRLLYWAMGEIVKEYLAGRAAGLEPFIRRLK